MKKDNKRAAKEYLRWECWKMIFFVSQNDQAMLKKIEEIKMMMFFFSIYYNWSGPNPESGCKREVLKWMKTQLHVAGMDKNEKVEDMVAVKNNSNLFLHPFYSQSYQPSYLHVLSILWRFGGKQNLQTYFKMFFVRRRLYLLYLGYFPEFQSIKNVFF